MAKYVTPEMIKINKKLLAKDGTLKQRSFASEAWFRLSRNRTGIAGLIIVALLLLCGVFASVITKFDPAAISADICQAPSGTHLFGTDALGRDLFTRCMYGARVSVPMGVGCMLCSLFVGGLIGLIAGFFGGRVDNILMRIMDIFQSIPAIMLAITIIAAIGTGTMTLILAIAMSSMPAKAKTVRSAILTVRGNDYVDAAKCIGASNFRIMMKHMLPNSVGVVIIYAVSSVAGGIMIIATLSYIGLGIQPPTPEWGSILSAGKAYMASYPHLVLFPGIMIMLTVLGFNMLGDGLRDALDPRLK